MTKRLLAWRLYHPLGMRRALALIVLCLAATALFAGFTIPRTAFLIVDGATIYSVEGYSQDVDEAFVRAGVTLNEDDSYEAAQLNRLVRIRVIRTAVSSQTVSALLPRDTIRRPNPQLPLGTEQVVQEGVDGIRTVVTETTAITGRAPVETFSGVETTPAVPRIIEYGTGVARVKQSALSVSGDVLAAVDAEGGTLTTASGKQLSYSKSLDVTATAYTTERQAWKITATGTTARVGAIAVDPKVIPYGTRMFIVSADGSITYGLAVAEDCGGSIKGNKIDLFFNTYDECISFGRRACTVYILN